ncbi:MAG TPA: hypothetical protein VEQ64_02425, partial [Xanthobacteraceae bacterium]|nr:hypothetical protein [Xanthobacteraceae bacterium]
ELAWRKSIAILEEGALQPRTLSLFPEDRCEARQPRVLRCDTPHRVDRARDIAVPGLPDAKLRLAHIGQTAERTMTRLDAGCSKTAAECHPGFAPVGKQAPPARAAPSLVRALRDARGALQLAASAAHRDQVLALASGKTQQEIAAACKGARPNHVGAAISRHKRVGRIEERDGKLYAT